MKTVKMRALTAAILAGSAAAPGIVFASTAANTTITNTVTVNFDNAAGIAQTEVTDTVSFTVDLVPAALTVNVSEPDIDPASEDTDVTLNYTVTGNANGPDTYVVSIASSDTDMDNPATLTPISVDLGGTTLAAAAPLTATSITVPYDGTDDGDVNGIVAGDFIMIGGNPYEVGSVDESTGAASNTVTINLVGAIATTAGVLGDIVGERQDVAVVVTTDFVTDPAVFGTHSVVSTFTGTQPVPAPALPLDADSAATLITVRKPVLTVAKYVRNSTTGTAGTGTSITVDGGTYYPTGVTGSPGDVMEYLIVVDNSTAGAGVADNIIIDDPIPLFTTYEAGSVAIIPAFDNSGATWPTGATFGADLLDAGNDSDAAEYDAGSTTVYVYAGAGGDDDGALDTGTGTNGDGEGGSLAAQEISAVRFRVTID